MNGLWIVLGIAAAVIGAILAPPWLQRRRRVRLLAAPADSALATALAATRAWRRLPDALRAELAGRVRVFLAEQRFVGCGGMQVDATMRIEIASQACLLLVGRPELHFDALRAILVYPGGFLVPRRDEQDGIVTEYQQEVSGESWDTSSVILAWDDVASADADCSPVLHEFAHYLDHARDATAALPVLAVGSRRLEATIAAGRDAPIGADALENDAEFFAFATEAFFEAPARLEEFDATLYAALAGFYGVDPARW